MDDTDEILALDSHPSWRVSWDALEARARTRLDGTGQVPPAVRQGRPFHGLPRLRLWSDSGVFGCDAEPIALTVFELFTDRGMERAPVVREAIWNRTADIDRMRGGVGRARIVTFLEPTMAVKFGRVLVEELARLVQSASGFRVPVTWSSESESVSSGEYSAGFEFFNRNQPSASLRLTWSYDPPAEWGPVIDWYVAAWDDLRKCATTAEIPFG